MDPDNRSVAAALLAVVGDTTAATDALVWAVVINADAVPASTPKYCVRRADCASETRRVEASSGDAVRENRSELRERDTETLVDR